MSSPIPPLRGSPMAASTTQSPCLVPVRRARKKSALHNAGIVVTLSPTAFPTAFDSRTELSLDGLSLSPTLSQTSPRAQPSPSGYCQLPIKQEYQQNNDNQAASPSTRGENAEARRTRERRENAEARRTREEEDESVALARMLMEQEAMESYALSADFLQHNQGDFSNEDYAALQAAMAEEDPLTDAVDGDDSNEAELSYDTMLRLGEQIGDVKQERWALMAREQIDRLPQFKFDPGAVLGKDENDSNVKCLVCQCPYEKNEELRNLPCGHCFHTDCVDQWLMSKDSCPYCRQNIVALGN